MVTRFNSVREFAEELEDSCPPEWNVTVDDQSVKQVESGDDSRIGFQRDDLMSFLVEIPYDETWPPSKLYVHAPDSVAGIPDRPQQPPAIEVDGLSINKVVDVVVENSPEYKGTFEYEDDEEN